jgi:hypothetical protein
MKSKQGQVSVQSLRSLFAGGLPPAKSLMQKTHTQRLWCKVRSSFFPNSETHPQILRRNRKVITPKSTPPPGPHQRFNFLFLGEIWPKKSQFPLPPLPLFSFMALYSQNAILKI